MYLKVDHPNLSITFFGPVHSTYAISVICSTQYLSNIFYYSIDKIHRQLHKDISSCNK